MRFASDIVHPNLFYRLVFNVTLVENYGDYHKRDAGDGVADEIDKFMLLIENV